MDLKFWRIFLYFPPEQSHYGKINCPSRHLYSQAAARSTDIRLCCWLEELHLRSRLMFLRLCLFSYFCPDFGKISRINTGLFLYLVGYLEYPWVWVSILMVYSPIFILECHVHWDLFLTPQQMGLLCMVPSRKLRSKLPMCRIRINITPFIDYLISLGIKIYQIHIPIS